MIAIATKIRQKRAVGGVITLFNLALMLLVSLMWLTSLASAVYAQPYPAKLVRLVTGRATRVFQLAAGRVRWLKGHAAPP